MSSVFSTLKDILHREAWIPFSTYMHLSLSHPEWGYYNRSISPFGRYSGDFCTAPELSSLFARAVARQVIEACHHIGEFVVYEYGPGSGAMCMDILAYAAEKNYDIAYYLIEVSPARQKEQYIRLSTSPWRDKVRWISSPPDNASGVVIANEVLDAIAVDLIVWDKNIQVRGVSLSDDRLYFADRDLKTYDDHLYQQALLLPPAHEDYWPYCSEMSIQQDKWLTACIEKMNTAFFLWIDYGFPQSVYYHPDRHMGTVMCHIEHTKHPDPLAYPGEQDITAHVNFTKCADCGLNAGAKISGFVTQAQFLINLDILQDCEQMMSRLNQVNKVSLLQSIQLLLHPGDMGEVIQVIGMQKNLDHVYDWTGFSEGDRSGVL